MPFILRGVADELNCGFSFQSAMWTDKSHWRQLYLSGEHHYELDSGWFSSNNYTHPVVRTSFGWPLSALCDCAIPQKISSK